MYQEYFIEYLRCNPLALTPDMAGFKGVDYVLWISAKHSEFKRGNGINGFYTDEQRLQFLKFLKKSN